MSVKTHTAGEINVEREHINTSTQPLSAELLGKDKEQQPVSAVKHQREFSQRQKTMAKRVVTTSFAFLGLSVVLGYADVLNDQATNSSAELPPQAAVSWYLLFRSLYH